MAITIMGGLFVATVLALLVVPALYSLWFAVRSDETLDAHIIQADLAGAFDRQMEPIRITAE
jgi:multidrug efflux pump